MHVEIRRSEDDITDFLTSDSYFLTLTLLNQ